jgi:hypothetical protein
MNFLGGTLRGKADFIAKGGLLLDGGEKRVGSLAKLLNYGQAFWGTGDIVTEDEVFIICL